MTNLHFEKYILFVISISLKKFCVIRYDVMKLCWKDDSALRPQFSGLVVLIEDQLKAVAAYLSVI